MSDRGTHSSVSGDTDADAVPTADAAPLWAPHGRALTGCLVVVNVALVLLVYLYFWRVFSRKRAAAAASAPSDDDEDASSSASAPPAAASGRTRDDVLASLPVFVVRSSDGSAGGGGEKAEAECAVCIAELRDGDECRALPRCGHRFHAACVDAWLRLHTTCPLCRASVVVVAAPERKGGVADTTAAAEDVDARV